MAEDAAGKTALGQRVRGSAILIQPPTRQACGTRGNRHSPTCGQQSGGPGQGDPGAPTLPPHLVPLVQQLSAGLTPALRPAHALDVIQPLDWARALVHAGERCQQLHGCRQSTGRMWNLWGWLRVAGGGGRGVGREARTVGRWPGQPISLPGHKSTGQKPTAVCML